MSDPRAFERVLASLYDAMLDETHWPATSALIDEACGVVGNALLVGEGPKKDIQILFVGLYYRGQRRTDLEREYLEVYHPINECIPRLRELPAGHLVHFKDLLTAEELKTSRTYNELFLRGKYQNGLNVLLDGPGGSRMTWGLGDPAASDGWGASQIAMVTAAAAPYPAVRPRQAGAGPRPGGGHDRDRPAREPADRHPPPGPARADPGGQ